jgi:glycosyltransferase involved in cell wall biosynthesis
VKILQMVQTLNPSTGGVAKAVISLSRAVAKKGHEIEIVCLDQPDANWISDSEIKVTALGVGLTNYRYSPALLPWLREHRALFDAAIVNGLWQYLGFAAWRAFARTALPYYVFPHGMLDPWFKRTFPRKHLKKWLYYPWADYRLLRDARAVIYTAEEERQEARKSFWLYREREKVSPLGVEAPERIGPPLTENFLKNFPQLRGKKLLLFLGRIHPKKGCDLLIEAFQKISDAHPSLFLVMAGPDQVGWETSLRNGGANVVFTGMLEGELKRGAFEAADAFILPSHQENFGMAVAEALSFGLPVLISNRVNIWREIEADGAGLVEPDNAEGTARLIDRWLSLGELDRQKMRANARCCFEKRFEIERAAESLLQILHEPA